MSADTCYPVCAALVVVLSLLPSVTSGPVEEKRYLYLGPGRDYGKILELPSLAEVPCEQHCPFGPGTHNGISGTSAAVVPYDGAGTLMICGLKNNLRGCYVWKQSGWELSDTLFNGTLAASSMLADGRWLVTGGLWTYDWDHDVALSSARTYSEADGWSEFYSLPVARYSHCQVTVGNDVYVIGGHEGSLGSGAQSSVFILSDAGEWVKGESLPTPLFKHACAVMGSKIYVVGGHDGNTSETSVVYTLDSSSPGSSWELGPELPVQLSDAQAFVYDDKIYLLGGQGPNDYVNDVFTLAPDAQSWSVVSGSNIIDERFTFPAPFISKDAMHCN